MAKAGIAFVVAAAVGAIALAADRGTPEEAKALLNKAAAHYGKVGRTQALGDFMSKKGPWLDRDLYVVCIAANHTITANGAYPAYVGTSSDALKDADGKPLGAAFWNAVAKTSEGTVEYRWFNPVSKRIERKVGFVRKAGDELLVVGAYLPQ